MTARSSAITSRRMAERQGSAEEKPGGRARKRAYDYGGCTNWSTCTPHGRCGGHQRSVRHELDEIEQRLTM